MSKKTYSFVNGNLTVENEGTPTDAVFSGYLSFTKNNLDFEYDEETGIIYQVSLLFDSELIRLRDFLNEIFPK